MDVEPLHFRKEGRAFQSKPRGGSCGPADDPIGFVQDTEDVYAFGLFKAHGSIHARDANGIPVRLQFLDRYVELGALS